MSNLNPETMSEEDKKILQMRIQRHKQHLEKYGRAANVLTAD